MRRVRLNVRRQRRLRPDPFARLCRACPLLRRAGVKGHTPGAVAAAARPARFFMACAHGGACRRGSMHAAIAPRVPALQVPVTQRTMQRHGSQAAGSF